MSRILSNKMTPEKKREAKEKIFQLQQELNQGEDEYFYKYNEDTEEFELGQEDAAADIARRITAAILRTDDRIESSTSRSEKRQLYKIKEALITYLKKVGMIDLAEALE